MGLMEVGNLIEIHNNPVDRYWTGQGELAIGGETYKESPGIVSIGELTLKSGDQTSKMQLTVVANDNAFLQRYINDLGPLKVVIKWIYRLSMASGWVIIDHLFEGYLNGYSSESRTTTFRLATTLEDIKENPIRFMSHENQQDLHPQDRGFTYLRTLSERGLDA